MDIWNVVVWLHLLAMGFFVGGQLFMAAVVVPVMRGDENREKLLSAARRFGYGTAVAFGVLIASGAAMASHFNLWSDSTLNIKLTLFLVMLVLIGVHMKLPRAHALEGIVFLLSLVIMWLGVTIGH